MNESIIPMVYRVTKIGEAAYLNPCDQAILVTDSMDCLSDEYGLYLVPEADYTDYIGRRNVFPVPENCESGAFVLLSGDGKLKVLSTADRPDRTLYTTGLCNSNCIMCPYSERFRLNSQLESLNLLNRFIELMDPQAEYICITGGEPTLLKDGFLDLVEHVNSHFASPILHILTNGRTFSYKSFFEAYRRRRPYQTLLGIPLHAAEASLHDAITQTPGSFHETRRGVDNLYNAGERIEIRVVTSKLNYKDLASLSHMIAERYPYCQHVCFMGLEMMGNAMINRKEVWCNYDTLWPYIREACEILVAAGVNIQLYNYPLCVINQSLQPLYHRSITPSKIEYLPECDSCSRKRECGGFFRTTKVMPDITVKPY